jgi:CDGSH-type Zn-finger protein
MQLQQRRQMVQGMAANDFLFGQFQEFSMQLPLVRAEVCAVSIQVLSVVYLLSHGCICGMHSQHSPNCDRRHENVESRDQSKLQVLRNKRNDHHHEQKLHDVKVEQCDDMESLQIY